MNFFRPFRAYRPYKLFGAGGALPSFRAFTYDPSTYELLSYHSGEGDVETDRVAVINVPDADGTYVEIPSGEIAYPGARVVENLIATAGVGTTDFTGWSAYLMDVVGNVATATAAASTGVRMVAQFDGTGLSGEIHQYRVSATIGGSARTVRFGIYDVSTAWSSGKQMFDYAFPGGTQTIDISCPVADLSPETTFNDAYLRIISAIDDGEIGDTITLHYAQVEDVTSQLDKNPSNFTSEIEQYANYNGNTVDETTGFVTEANGALLDPIPSALVAPETTNQLGKSRDFDAWVNFGGFATLTQNQIGIDGTPNIAFLYEDAATGGYADIYASSGTPILSDNAVSVVRVRKDTDQSRFFGVKLMIGTNQYKGMLNTQTGAHSLYGTSTGVGSASVVADGDWWKYCISLNTPTPGVGATVTSRLYAAISTVWESAEASATGSVVIDVAEVYYDTPLSDVITFPPIYTAGAAALRDKDEIILDNANLNTTEGSIYFELTPGQDTTNLIDGFMSLENGFVVIDDGTNATAAAALVDTNVESSVGMVWSAEGMKCCANGTWSQLVPYDGTVNDGVLDLLRDATASNQIRDLQIWDSAEEQAITDLMPVAEDYGEAMVFVVRTTTSDETVKIPLSGSGIDALFDWGDGTAVDHITSSSDPALTHTYAEAGSYIVQMNGSVVRIYYNNTGDKDKLTGVLSAGDNGIIYLDSAFRGCTELVVAEISGLSSVDLVSPLSLNYIYSGCVKLVTASFPNMSGIAISSVLQAFSNAYKINSIDLSTADSISIGSYAFSRCYRLTQVLFPSTFNTSPTNISYLFYLAFALHDVDLTFMGYMWNATNYAQTFRDMNALPGEKLDEMLESMYANRMNYVAASPAIDISYTLEPPSGVYQDATPPTTGEEFRYKLENDPDGEGFNTWTITV